jgi:hypothetical protein
MASHEYRRADNTINVASPQHTDQWADLALAGRIARAVDVR